jgi:hypothetical protein
MREMVKEMDKYKVDICALQEIRWPGKGTVINKNYMILYSGNENKRTVSQVFNNNPQGSRPRGRPRNR